MRAVVITKHGDPSVLQVQERPDPPPPGPGQLQVAVRAAGVNFADHLARVGLYPDAPKLPAIVGYEVAGTVEAVGEGVDVNRLGERVLAGTRFGGYAEIVNVAAADSVALPDAMSFEQGAAVPVNYATAWAALHGYGSLRAGERVLIHAAAGGVGTAAIQFAKAAGAEVHGTASPGKHQKLTELGVTARSTTAATAGGRVSARMTSCSTHSAAPRCGGPMTCCAPAEGLSAKAFRTCSRVRNARCAGWHHKRWRCCVGSACSTNSRSRRLSLA
jgi:NADPH:quinone reductase-like Zn-dependent oxidoreductase